jgi:hypothetical protein
LGLVWIILLFYSPEYSACKVVFLSRQNPFVTAAEELLGYWVRRQVTDDLPFGSKPWGGYGFDRNWLGNGI